MAAERKVRCENVVEECDTITGVQTLVIAHALDRNVPPQRRTWQAVNTGTPASLRFAIAGRDSTMVGESCTFGFLTTWPAFAGLAHRISFTSGWSFAHFSESFVRLSACAVFKSFKACISFWASEHVIPSSTTSARRCNMMPSAGTTFLSCSVLGRQGEGCEIYNLTGTDSQAP